MAWGQPLGLDELMIINPGASDAEAYFLGDDGTLYQVQGLGSAEDLQGSEQYFLGDDGTLYQVQGLGLEESPNKSLNRPIKHHTCRCMNG
jgi:hypothetical protein